jgi:hypothetical protein
MWNYFEKHVIGVTVIVLLLLGGIRLFFWHGEACLELHDDRGQSVDGCSFDFYGAKEFKPEAEGPASCSRPGHYYFETVPAWQGIYFLARCGDRGGSRGQIMVMQGSKNHVKAIVSPSTPLLYWEEEYTGTSPGEL